MESEDNPAEVHSSSVSKALPPHIQVVPYLFNFLATATSLTVSTHLKEDKDTPQPCH